MTDYPISDCTNHDWDNPDDVSLDESFGLILYDMEIALEKLADGVAYSAGPMTEQGKRHKVYANGSVKDEGAHAPVIVCKSLSKHDQIDAVRKACKSTYEAVAEAKDGDILVWRRRPELTRGLHEDGLHIMVSVRLSWVPRYDEELSHDVEVVAGKVVWKRDVKKGEIIRIPAQMMQFLPQGSK